MIAHSNPPRKQLHEFAFALCTFADGSHAALTVGEFVRYSAHVTFVRLVGCTVLL
jgi:hypothetical protein